MNVLLISHTHGFGGVERHVVLLARGLSDRGHSVLVAGPASSWLAQACERQGMAFHHVAMRGLGDPISHAAIACLAVRHRASIVHGHARRSAFYGTVAGRVTNRCSISTVHSLNSWKGFHRSDQVIAVSDAVRSCLIAHGISQHRIEVVYDGVPSLKTTDVLSRETIRRRLGIPLDEFAVAMTGRIVAHKGHDLIIEALRRLASRFPRLHVYVIGKGQHEQRRTLSQLARSCNVEARIHFLGYRDDVSSVLLAMDAFALPSRSEALSMAMLEAMAAGLPVVAARVGGVPEVISHGRNGLLVEPSDPVALADAIAALIGEPALRHRLGAGGRDTQASRFSDDGMITAIESVYLRAAKEFELRPTSRKSRTKIW